MEEDILSTIKSIETVILQGKRPMMGAGKIVDDANILRLLNYLRNILPEEIGIAKMVVRTQDEIIGNAQAEANSLLENARIKVNKSLDEHALRQQAKLEADELVSSARNYANSLKQGAYEEIMKIVSSAEFNLNDVLNRVTDAKAAIINSIEAGSSTASGNLENYNK